MPVRVPCNIWMRALYAIAFAEMIERPVLPSLIEPCPYPTLKVSALIVTVHDIKDLRGPSWKMPIAKDGLSRPV